MSAETGAVDPYEMVLADLRAKRAQIDQAIDVLVNLRAGAVSGAMGPIAPSSNAANEHGIVETAGMYLGMSIVDATKKLLALRKSTMGNVDIARELQKGGLVFSGEDPANVVGSVLTRRFNNVGDVVKIGRGIWGLKEWYPGRNFKPPIKMATVTSTEIGPITAERQAMMDANLAALAQEEGEQAEPDVLG